MGVHALLLCAGVFGAPFPAGTAATPASAPAAGADIYPIEEKPLPHEELCAPGTTIGELEIIRLNVFDTAQEQYDKKLFRFVNVLHSPMKTRLATVRSLLTIEPGQPCSLEDLEEAERELRKLAFVQDAWVEPVARRGDSVQVRVRVQDAWSTRLGFSFSNEGGETQTLFRIKENNFLGTGSRLIWSNEEDLDRTERTLEYFDPALGRSRWQLDAATADNSDGDRTRLEIARPFYKLDARWATRVGGESFARDEKVFVRDAEVDRWRHDGHGVWAGYGLAPGGYRDGKLLRLEVGVRDVRSAWTPALPMDPVARPDLRPLDRDMTLVGIRGSWQSIDIRRVQYLETAKRVEDIDLSQRLEFGIERSVHALSDDSGSVWHLGYQRGFQPFETTIVVLGGGFGVERVRDAWVNGEVRLTGRLFRRLAPDQTMVLSLDVRRGERLEGHRRYLLGGDTGLRGYPTRAFSGDRRVLLVGEHRYFAPWELFGVVRLGLVGFFDVGGAWDGGEPFDSSRFGGNVGIGLRGLLRPSSGDTTVHVNLTYAVGQALADDRERLRLTVSTASTF